ncbi:MAG: Rad2 nuclease [Trichoglossum hirsutum]|jgi:exonuclease-1|nr:MAG: Rad2 nuclease [Trichoglossum hirsutum]
MLQHFGVIPFLVFDGDYLPSKAATEASRASKREESRQLGLELYRLGKRSQAHLELQKAIDVSPEMAGQLIKELKVAGVQYIVAPYEADAQLVYLERNGIISGILSEDSDLLVFGARCLLTKLDQHGDCITINRVDFAACKDISLVGWSDADFRRMAILSGCDYLASMSKMGLKTAYRLVRKHKSIERILSAVQFDGQFRVPAGYLQAFRKAEVTFLHQRVFCPIENVLVMNTIPNEELDEDMLFVIGQDIERGIAIGVARGDLHPMTKEPLEFENPRNATPRTPYHVRKQISSKDDPKSCKSIDTFFKPKRTPLAELDPNSFTPSPSQERLLQQRPSGQWSASPAMSSLASNAPGVSPLSTRNPTPQSAPSLLQRATTRSLPTPTSIPAPRPQKRQRLCADDIDKPITYSVMKGSTEKSRFFAPKLSHITGRDPQRQTPKKQGPNILSDDSLDEALASLPEFGDPPELPMKTKLSVFEDEDPSYKLLTRGQPSQRRVPRPNPQAETTGRLSQNSEFDPFIETPVSFTTCSVLPQVVAEAAEPSQIMEKFAYQPATVMKGSTAKRPKAHVSDALSSALPEVRWARGKVTVSAKPTKAVPSTTPASKGSLSTHRSTPLQRLGTNALGRAKSKEVSNIAYSAMGKANLNVAKATRSPVRSSTESRLTKCNPTGVRDAPSMPLMKGGNVGSEDLLVRDFEEGWASDPPSPAHREAEEGIRACFSPGKYMFAPK